MAKLISMSPKMFTLIRNHLLQSSLEQVAFGFGKKDHSNMLTIMEVIPVPSENLEIQEIEYVVLSESTQAKLIKHAWDTGTSLVEFHSHPKQPQAHFSHSDLCGFREFVPHVWWRLKGAPYVAVVMGPRNFDALIWSTAPTVPERLDYLHVGLSIKQPTGLTINFLERGLIG